MISQLRELTVRIRTTCNGIVNAIGAFSLLYFVVTKGEKLHIYALKGISQIFRRPKAL